MKPIGFRFFIFPKHKYFNKQGRRNDGVMVVVNIAIAAKDGGISCGEG